MGRLARMVFPGFPHHVTQRGIRRLATFYDRDDRLKFIKLLVQHATQFCLEIWAWVLMTNHFHIIAVPQTKDSLSDAMRDCLSDYALYFNERYGYKGHLWQERFHSSVMGPDYLFNGVRYVERNPVRAGLVGRAEEYEWSSAAYHCGLRTTDPLISENSPLIGALDDWSAWLDVKDDAVDQVLRRAIRTGRPTTASKEFLRMLESRLGKPVTPKRRGRPPKKSKDDGAVELFPFETTQGEISDLSPIKRTSTRLS